MNLISSLKDKKDTLKTRAKIIQAIRGFFIERDFLEVETPLRVRAPAPELHLKAVKSGDRWLVTSPELQMKQLVAAGYERIFQVCRVFRDAESGRMHNPEFTMLEWYRADADYAALMDDMKEIVLAAAQAAGSGRTIKYGNLSINLDAEWKKSTVSDAFEKFAGYRPGPDPDPDRFDVDMVDRVEPELGITVPTFLIDYPASMCSLSRIKKDNPGVCERVELYIAGVELANGFSELVDSREQRRRFERDLAQREAKGLDVYPIDENFLKALDHMSVSAGCALGIDRLVMLLCNKQNIHDVMCFTAGDS